MERSLWIDVLEQLIPWEILAAPHDLSQALVDELDVVLLTALAAETEADVRALHTNVPVTQCGEAERTIGSHVFLVPDARQGALQQAHDGSQDFGSRQTGKAKVEGHAPANLGQRAGKGGQDLVFGRIAHLPPARVVTILLASSSVARRDLQMAVLERADPHVGPRGRNDERTYAFQSSRIA